MANPFRYFDSSPVVIRLVVLMDVRYPLSLRNVEDLLFERGIDICHETARLDHMPGAMVAARRQYRFYFDSAVPGHPSRHRACRSED
jgi:hypothetical protein